MPLLRAATAHCFIQIDSARCMKICAWNPQRALRSAHESGGSWYGHPSVDFSREYRESGAQMH